MQDRDSASHSKVRTHLRSALTGAEQVLNGLSASLELPRLLLLSDQEQVRPDAMKRVTLVLKSRSIIDQRLDGDGELALERLPGSTGTFFDLPLWI